MGELLFTLGYGGALIIIGIIVHFFIKKMEQKKTVKVEQTNAKKEVL